MATVHVTAEMYRYDASALSWGEPAYFWLGADSDGEGMLSWAYERGYEDASEVADVDRWR